MTTLGKKCVLLPTDDRLEDEERKRDQCFYENFSNQVRINPGE